MSDTSYLDKYKQAAKELTELDTVTLTARHFARTDIIPLEAFVNVRMDDMLNGMAVSLSAYIWEEEIETQSHEFYASWPSSWWQHFKKECFPKWLLARYPVQMVEKSEGVEFKQVALFPKLAEVHPGAGPHVTKIFKTRF